MMAGNRRRRTNRKTKREWEEKLQSACKAGDFETVLEVIGEGCSPRRMLKNGLQPLHYATAHGQLNVVRTLVEEHHCDVACRDREGCTPLHYASYYGHVDVVKCMVNEQKCKPFVKDKRSLSPLHYAIGSTCMYMFNPPLSDRSECNTVTHFGIVKFFLVDCGYSPEQFGKVSDLKCILLLACKYGTLEEVKYLIETKKQSFSLEACTEEACKVGKLDILKYLLEEKGCQLEKQQYDSLLQSLFITACLNGRLEMVRYLIEEKQYSPSMTPGPLYYVCGKWLPYGGEEQAISGKHVQVARYLVVHLHCDPIKHTAGWRPSPVEIACEKGSVKLVEALLTCRDVNCQDEDGNTPLHLACNYEQVDTVRLLTLEKCCSQSVQKSNGELPLHIACCKGSREIVELVSSCNVNTVNNNGDTPLHIACTHKHVDVVSYLTKEKACDCTIQNKDGELPLHVACNLRCLEMVRLVANCRLKCLELVRLVDNCNIHTKTVSGETPMHIACKEQAIEIVKHLVHAKKFDAMMQPELYKDLRIHVACETCDLEVVKALATPSNVNCQAYFYSNDTPLHVACRNTRTEIVRFLVNEVQYDQSLHWDMELAEQPPEMTGCLVESGVVGFTITNHRGELPMHVACGQQSLEIVELVSKCDPNSRDRDGNTPLHIACQKGAADIVKYLRERNCDPTIANDREELPLHLACRHSLEMVELVTDCDVNAKSQGGVSPLQIACSHGKLEIVKYLIEEEHADAKTVDKKGLSLLHYACNCLGDFSTTSIDISDNNVQVARYLMTKVPCNPLAWKTLEFQYEVVPSPMELACKTGHLELAKALTTTNTVNCVSLTGDTSLHLACKYEQLLIVKFLVEVQCCNQSVKNHEGELALHVACRFDSLGIVKLVSNCDVSTQTVNEDTALHLACKHGDPEIVAHLLEKKCNPNIQNSKGDTALHLACKHGDPEIVAYLLEKKCNPNIHNSKGELPLHIASCKSLDIVKLVSNCDDINTQKKDGDTALHFACGSNAPELVTFLVQEKQCDPTIANNIGELPLHLACDRGSLEIVKLVSGCDVDAKTAAGKTALHMAFERHKYDIMNYLTRVKHADSTVLIHRACRKGIRAIKALATLESVDFVDEDGNTPLHIACMEGRLNIMRYLTQEKHCDLSIQNHEGNGLNQQIPNHKGELPLHLACSHSLELVKLVSNCNPNTQQEDGNTPLHIACRHNKGDIVRFLIDYLKCDPSIQNKKKELPLHIACQHCSLKCVKMVSRGCNPDTQQEDGDTPLHIACNNNKEGIVQFLVSYLKCDPSIQNKKKELPLHIACQTCSLQYVSLVSSGCNPDTQREDGDTPLHIVCRYEKVDIIRFLTQTLKCASNIQNQKGELPVHIACQNFCIKSVELVSRNCNLDVQQKNGDTPLHIACRKPSMEIVHHLAKAGSSVNVPNSHGQLPLHILIDRSSHDHDYDYDIEVETMELVCPRNVDSVNTDGDTPLHIACKNMYIMAVEFLLETKHCEISIQNNKGDTPLHIACTEDSEIVQILLRASDHGLKLQNKDGKLPLHIVCSQYGVSLEIVKLVSSCDVNCRTVSGDTPLHLLTGRYYEDYEEDYEDIVHYLTLTKKCDTNIPNNKGELPLHIALACSSVHVSLEVVKMVSTCDVNKQMETGDTPLHIACRVQDYYPDYYYSRERNTNEVVVSYLTETKKCDTDIPNNKGELPLHIVLACRSISLEVVKMVSKCDVNKQMETGDTPLHVACRVRPHESYLYSKKENTETIEYLVNEKHCDVTIANKNKELPLHIACRMQSLAVVQLLINKDVSLNAQTVEGNSPLHEACQSEEIVEHLIGLEGCNVYIKNSKGELPLHIACRNRSFKMVKYLSESEPHVQFKTHLGNTPLHEACRSHASDSTMAKIANYLVQEKNSNPNGKNCDGKTPLHFACEVNARKTVEILLSVGEADPSVADCKGQTPLMVTIDNEVIKLLLAHGADPKPLYEAHQKFFEEYSSSSPPPTPLKILVVGNAATGKTTLVESLQNECGHQTPTQLDVSKLHTAGIVPTNFDSGIYGLVTLYDFAGQHEYYASHGAMIETIVRHSSPVILLLVNISEQRDSIEGKLLYWLSQLENQLDSARAKPHLMVVGSHADVVESEGTDPQEKIAVINELLRKRLQESPLKHVASVSMDCRQPNSEEINALQKHLKKSSNELRDMAVINFASHCLYVFFLDHFRSREAVTVEMVSTAISNRIDGSKRSPYHRPAIKTSPTALLPSSIEDVTRVCKELSEKGHLLFLENPNTPSMSWIILNKETLLAKINGTVFAPKDFRQHCNLASSTGVVPFSKIAAHIPWYDPNMIVEFLSYREFCHEIDDQELLQLIEVAAPKPTHPLYHSERYYFFPALVSIETPQRVWKSDKQFTYQCGWILECLKTDRHFFTPRFLQVLILRLAFSFELAPFRPVRSDDLSAIKRVCSVWKSGIAWRNNKGVETLVEIREQNQTLVVMIGCRKLTHVVEFLKLRSSVILKVLQAKIEFCPHVSTVESFIAPTDLQYPPKPSKNMTLFPMASVAASVVEGAPFVLSDEGDLIEVGELLYFEPYTYLMEDIIKKLFDETKLTEKVDDRFLHDLSKSLGENTESVQLDHVTKIFQLGTEGACSYSCLRKKLDNCSIFCGRNPHRLQRPDHLHDSCNKPRQADTVQRSHGYGSVTAQNIRDETKACPSSTLRQLPPSTSSPSQLAMADRKSGYLRGVDVVNRTSLTYSGKACSFHWKKHGLAITFPENALPPGTRDCHITITASISGQYQFPDNSELVSGIYWIACPVRLTRPVTLEIQHCSSQTEPDDNCLTFVIAESSQEDLPYGFIVLDDGTFSPTYGSIQPPHFSGFGIIKLFRRLMGRRLRVAPVAGIEGYCGQLYYIPQLADTLSWEIHFVIVRNLDVHRTAVENRYCDGKYQLDLELEVKFRDGENSIALDIPKEGTKVIGWNIFPRHTPEIFKRQVDSFEKGRSIPFCQLTAVWRSAGQPVSAIHRVDLMGAREPYNYISIQLPPGQLKPSSTGTDVSSQLASGELKTSSGASVAQRKLGKPTIRQFLVLKWKDDRGETQRIHIKDEIAPKWREVGIALGFRTSSLDAIAINCRDDVALCAERLFATWEKEGSNFNWDGLIEALDDANFKNLARDIKNALPHTI